jgi:hypothetical protein
MKKALLSLFAVAAMFQTQAQNFNYPDGQHRVETVTNENFEGYNIDILTDTPQDMHYEWELVSNSFPSAWSYSLCDYGGCAVGVPNSGSMTPITEDEMRDFDTKGFFKLNLTVGQNFGQGKIEIYVFDATNHDFGDTVSWDVSWLNTASVSTLDAESALLTYPNPVKDVLTISSGQSLLKNVKMYGIKGNLVLDQTVQTKELTLNTSTFKKGFYLLAVTTEDGQIIQRKLIVE